MIASSNQNLYQIADELRAMANQGLYFADNEYHKERYTRILSLSARLVSAIENRSPDQVLAEYQDNLMHLSPLVGAEAAVFRNGKLLLIQRRDDERWAIPGGLAEVGETWADTARRELWEEVCVRGCVTQLLAVFDSRLWQTRTRMQIYQAVFLVESQDTPTPGSEALNVGFFAENELPLLSQGHHLRVPLIFKMQRGEMTIPYIDKET